MFNGMIVPDIYRLRRKLTSLTEKNGASLQLRSGKDFTAKEPEMEGDWPHIHGSVWNRFDISRKSFVCKEVMGGECFLMGGDA